MSDFPGDAMNHGTQLDTDPDLKFDQAGNPGFTITSNQLTATTNSPVGSATVTVTAFDYGARGRIRATLVNLGCPPVEHEIPKDTDGDWLPDAYENMYLSLDANNADTDGDGTPDGQEDDDPERPVVPDAGPESHPAARSALGLVGDGLVAFEEYRGFFVMGTNTRTSTQVKDVFAGIDTPPNTPQISVGLGYFPNLTGFNVREIEGSDPNALEWQSVQTRFINWQRSGIPGATDQRALRVVRNDNLTDGIGNLLFGRASPLGVPNQSPNETLVIEINVAAHPAGMAGSAAGPDGMFCTADDFLVALTATQALDALRETVGHECAHACHVEHTFCFGDRQVIPFGQGLPNTTTVDSGPNGICDSAAVAVTDDVQLVPTGQGAPNAVIITAGPDGVLDSAFTLVGDDAVAGTTVVAGPDGIAQTTTVSDDVQVISVGKGQPNAACVDTGADGISNTSQAGDDVQAIAVGNGLANQTCIDDSGDGTLLTNPGGDDVNVGLTITTGPNGICETRAIAPIVGAPGLMTSDVLVPVPTTYTTDDLDQVRFHLKHP